MENIREIISKNIVELRKQKGLTQLGLAKKINFSDKAISRWEKAEVTPDVETLQNLGKIFGVPIDYFFEEHTSKHDAPQKPTRNELILQGLSICIVWTVITILFVYLQIIYNYTFWQAFVWGVPISVLLTLRVNKKWGNRIFKAILQTIFIWSLITSFYLQFLSQNLWLMYIIGIPIQAFIIVSFFNKPKLKEF